MTTDSSVRTQGDRASDRTVDRAPSLLELAARAPAWPDEDPRLTPIALRRELCALGYSDRAIQVMVRRGELARARRGAYVDAATWRGLDERQQHAVRTRAVLRQAGTDLVVSHTSAALEWDRDLWGVSLNDVYVTRPDQRAGRAEAGVRQHRSALETDDVVERNGLQVTSPVRTTLDLAALAGSEHGLVVANHFAHDGLLTPEALRERYARSETDQRSALAGRPGALSTHTVMLLVDPRIESVGESRLQHFLWKNGFPAPIPQYEVRDGGGQVVARLDFAFPELGIALEFDGRIKYTQHLRPGQTAADVVLSEKERDRLVEELTGMRVYRLRWVDLERPAATAVRLRRIITPGRR